MKTTGRPAKLVVSCDGAGIVGQAGGVLLTQTFRATGLDRALSAGLERWRKPRATHDPGKVVSDLAMTLALGGDCLSDIALLRAEPELFGPVPSDPTVSRLVATLAQAGPQALRAIGKARAAARARAWELAGERAPGTGGGLIPVDLDATIVLAHSDKEHAAPTWKRTFGHHPMTAFIDHGPGGTGEAAALVLRPGNAGSNTAADHITAGRLALNQIPSRLHKQVIIRTDSGGGTHEFLDWVTARRIKYSIGFNLTDDICAAILALPEHVWQCAYDADRRPRRGAWVAELTGMLDLTGWPKGMRVIVRRERPHPGAQLRFTDIDGHRFTCFVTGTRHGQLADLELRHRRRARCEDRIRCVKDTGLRNLPLHSFAANQIWLELVALAADLTAWTQMLAFADHPARLWDPNACACASSRPPHAWHGAADGSGSDWPATGPGAVCSPRRSGACRCSRRPDQQQAVPTTPGRRPPGPWNPAHPTRQSGPTADPPPKAKGRLGRSATQPTSRNIEGRE